MERYLAQISDSDTDLVQWVATYIPDANYLVQIVLTVVEMPR